MKDDRQNFLSIASRRTERVSGYLLLQRAFLDRSFDNVTSIAVDVSHVSSVRFSE